MAEGLPAVAGIHPTAVVPLALFRVNAPWSSAS